MEHYFNWKTLRYGDTEVKTSTPPPKKKQYSFMDMDTIHLLSFILDLIIEMVKEIDHLYKD